jgi:N utilization substance protein A
VRIQAIVRELNDEKIDVIEWNPDPAAYIAKALSPARVTGVYLDDSDEGPKTATVVVPEDGRDGQNARLAAKLTGWRIDIKSLPEATSDILFKLQNDPEYRTFAVQEQEALPIIEAILSKKTEGRPVTPEEFNNLGSFVDRVERGVIEKRKAVKREWNARLQKAQEMVPNATYELPLETLGLPDSTQDLLLDEEYDNVGDLMLQMIMDPGKINEINGIGPKAMENIQDAIDALTSIMPKDDEPEAEELEMAVEAPVEADEAKDLETPDSSEEGMEPESVVGPDQVEDIILADGDAEAKSEEKEREIEPVSEDDDLVEEEEYQSLEEIFDLQPEMLDSTMIEDEDEDEDDDELVDPSRKRKSRKKKKKPKRYVEIEYDPEADVTLYRKRRKGEDDDWDDDVWDY